MEDTRRPEGYTRCRRRVVEDGDGLHFEERIGVCKRRGVQRNEFDVVVDEDGEAATTVTIWPISSDDGEVAEERIFGRWAKLGFLNESYVNFVFLKIVFELHFLILDAVSIPL